MQGCALRDQHLALAGRNVAVLGVSLDSTAENRAFRDKFAFPYPLLSDETGDMALAYGAIRSTGQRSAARIAVLVDPSGHVRHIEHHVNVGGFAHQVLSWLV